MAKTKKSRRVRRKDAEKQRRSGFETAKDTTGAGPTAPPAVAPDGTTVEAAVEAVSESRPQVNRKLINFVQEYLYVYRDLKRILVVAVFMFAVLVGLSFVI